MEQHQVRPHQVRPLELSDLPPRLWYSLPNETPRERGRCLLQSPRRGLVVHGERVDDGGTLLLVIGSADPAGLEGAEGSESGGTLPDSELTVSGSDNSNFHTGGSQFGDLGLESIGNTFVHGGTTGEDNVLAEILMNINK